MTQQRTQSGSTDAVESGVQILPHAVSTPRTADGSIDHDAGWRLWSDMVRYYPSGVHRRRLIRSWTSNLGATSLLDVGCGPGHLLDEFRTHGYAGPMTGSDNSMETIELNRLRQPWAQWEYNDITKSSLDKQFDLVICSEVLEHTVDDGAALANLARMSSRYLMVTVPAGPIRPLEAGFGHLRHYTPSRLESMTCAVGFDVIRSSAWGFPFMSAFKVGSNLRPQATMDGFGDGAWSMPKKMVGATLTGLFYGNVVKRGPQLLLLAQRRDAPSSSTVDS